MIENSQLDVILGVTALVILGGGLLMLFTGIKKMND